MSRKRTEQPLGTRQTLLETLEKLRANRVLYARGLLRIRTKSAELVPLEPNRAQRIVEAKLEAQFEETGRVRAVILKARQEGVSTWVAARFFHRLHLWSGRKALIIADAIDRAQALFGIYERYHDELPEDLRPGTKSRGTRRHLAFTHDSEVNIRPASDPDAGRAQTIHMLHASEIAFWPVNQQRDVWVSAMQAVPDMGSEIIVESTAKGAGGLFHELWELTQKKDSGWIGIFLPWWIHEEYEVEPLQWELDALANNPDDFEQQASTEGIPLEGKQFVLGPRKLAWRRRTIVERFGGDPVTLGKDATRDFQQEYPATAEEAFLVSGACYFDEDELRRMARHCTDAVATGRLIETTEDDKKITRLEKSSRGFLDIFEFPQEGAHYVIGADTAEGKLVSTRRVTSDTAAAEAGGRDNSSATVLKIRGPESAPKLVAVLHGHISPDIFARQMAMLGEYYACGGPSKTGHSTVRDVALIGVESNHSSGQRVLEYLKDILRYRRLYWQREIVTRTKNFERRPGWRTDERSRMILLDTLAELIRKGQIEVPDANTVRELTTFVVWETGKPAAEEGTHDDRVISLALAVQMAKEHRHAAVTAPPAWEAAETASGL